jgi:predicted alpha/beta-fold hydrolase
MAVHVEHWKFRPHPLLRSGHLQTVAGIYLPRRYAPYGATRHYVLADHGPAGGHHDQIVLHEDRPADVVSMKPVVLLVHGLSGCHQSSYMCRMSERLVDRGYVVFRMDMRGCGAGQEVARMPTHCGRAGDVAAAVRKIAELHPEAPTLAVGYSMGGTLGLNLLAEAGDTRVGNLERVLAICPAIDLVSISRQFGTRLGRPYDIFFLKFLWEHTLVRWRRFPDVAPAATPRKPARLRDFDELVIAPAGGFESADHYYRTTQPGPKLASIRQPATIIATKDDPIVPLAPLMDYPRSASVETVIVPFGGHLGFIAARNGDPDSRWLDWRIIDWIESGR